jgi:agmatine deiminase
MGPIFVVVNNSVKEKKVVDFGFNGWGLPKYFFPHDLATDEQVDRSIAAEQGLNPPLSAPIISEGGNREFNGQGTMIAIAKTELQRNPDFTREQLEEVYGEFLGVKKVIWLEQGVVEDSPPTVGLLPGPDGTPSAYAVGVEHVDEVARFAGPNTILLAEVSAAEAQVNPIAAENRVRLEQAYEILRRAKDQDGKRFTIIRMPSAEVEYYTMFPVDDMYRWLSTMQFTDGSVFPLGKPVKVIVANGYMNFVITNGVVLAANYGDTTRDKKVAQILKMAFPNRKIVGINPFAINLGGGGMHCITQQEPRVESIGD